MTNKAGKPIANAVIRVRNDTSGRDIDHDITSGKLAEYDYLHSTLFPANATCTYSVALVMGGI